MGIRYRRVPCDHVPTKKAVRPWDKSGAWDTRPVPWGWDSSKDGRWSLWQKNKSWNFDGSSPAPTSTSTSSPNAGSQSSSVSATRSDGTSSGVGQQNTITNVYYGGGAACTWGGSFCGRSAGCA
jgi:hypothetical protein